MVKQHSGAAVAFCLQQACLDIGRQPELAAAVVGDFGSRPFAVVVRGSYSWAACHQLEEYWPEEHSLHCEERLRVTLQEHQWRPRHSRLTVQVH